MSQQMQLMYPETPCFGENTRTQKITQNTQKYTLRRAIKVTSSKFRGRHRQKTAPRAVFLAGVTDKNDAHLQFFLPGTLIFSICCGSRWPSVDDLFGALCWNCFYVEYVQTTVGLWRFSDVAGLVVYRV